MAANLLSKGATGVDITGRNKTRYGDLLDSGAHWHDSPRSLASSVDAILLMLPDLPEVEAVLGGPDGVLAGSFDHLLLIICSTSSPTGVRELAQRLRASSDGAVTGVARAFGG